MTDADTQLELNLRVGGESLQLAKAKELLLEAQELLHNQRMKCEAYDKQVNSLLAENNGLRQGIAAEKNNHAGTVADWKRERETYVQETQGARKARRELEGKLNLIPMWVRRIFGAD